MLGDLSARYESNGNPGTVSDGCGDAGGVSYGSYQLATNAGSVHSFLRYVREVGSSYADALAQYEPGSAEFTAEWQSIAGIDPGGFQELQHNYIQYAYYEPAIEALREVFFKIENHHEVMQQVIWSRAVQYGNGNIVELFEIAVKSLGYENLSYVDAPQFDADLIRAIYGFLVEEADNATDSGNGWYKSPQRWVNGSEDVVYGLRNRFVNECQDALNMLG